MVKINEAKWPVVYVHYDGERTAEDLLIFQQHFEQWLSHQERFGIVFIQTGMDQPTTSAPPKELHDAQVTWTQQHRETIQRYCVGMSTAIDATDPELLNRLRRVAPTYLEQTYACQGDIFMTLAEAEQWITQRLL